MNDQFKDFKPKVEYKVTVERLVTDIAYGKTSYEKIGTHQEDSEYNKKGDPEYAYVPKPPFIHTETSTVFQQTSDKTDILALIAAVNGVTFK